MEVSSGISVHYYFKGEQHLIDAQLRNKREAELLALYQEVIKVFGVDFKVYAMPSKEGGYIEFWQFLGDHSAPVTAASAIVAALCAFISHIPKSDKLQKQLTQLEIERNRLEISKLRKELEETKEPPNQKTIGAAVSVLNIDNKAVTRRSNFYKSLTSNSDVHKLGVTKIGIQGEPIDQEVTIARKDFPHFVMKTNKLPSVIDHQALIEIIAPVVGEGSYQWKGVYQEQVINFKMADEDFKNAVLDKSVIFKHGTQIECELISYRKLDESGEEVITGYTVPVILSIGEDGEFEETTQGNEQKQFRTQQKSQGDIFQPLDS